MSPGRDLRAARAMKNRSQEVVQKKSVASQTWRKTGGDATADAEEAVVDTRRVEIIAAGGDADARNIISRSKHDSRADRGSKWRRPRSRDRAYTSAECADPRITEPNLAPVTNDRETARRIREHDSYPRRRGRLIPGTGETDTVVIFKRKTLTHMEKGMSVYEI